MRCKRHVLILSTLLLALPSVAAAEKFSGFTARGGKFAQGAELCTPVRGDFDTPNCRTAAKPNLAKGILQTGEHALVVVKKTGTALLVLSKEDGSKLFRWDSGEVLTGIGDVYVDNSGCFVAVEYTLRIGGRIVDRVVVIALKKALNMGDLSGQLPRVADPTTTPPVVTTAKKPDKPVVAELPKGFVKELKEGVKWAARRKHSKAIASFQKALTVVPKQPEALYRLARSHYLAKDADSSRKTLKILAEDKSQQGAKWRVEARYDKAFKALRSDGDFRKSVGIDRAVGEKISSYERLVALGGKWEQESLPCEQPQVNLTLLRNKKRRFDLVIRSRCQGSKETTRLDGSWLASTNGGLHLKFPNTSSDDEDLVCQLELCSDGSGEDCLRCKPEPDIEFLLRVVRR
ncbi:MAG: hypothetical protein JKY56_26745 [Kofleriaceae bacterium]|nr:hypothetical protein [Kofleriaceae bacterium]